MTPAQREELKRLAEAATPGPWRSMGEFDTQHVVKAPTQMVCNTLHRNDEANALFIAAANPSAVLDLLAEHEEDQGVIAVWRGRTERAESERDALKAENEQLRLITEDFCNEVDRTAQWREAKGMKPATDTSEFCGAAPSVLINLKHWARRFREATKETP